MLITPNRDDYVRNGTNVYISKHVYNLSVCTEVFLYVQQTKYPDELNQFFCRCVSNVSIVCIF